MALVACKACGTDIADTAMVCPKCGDPKITHRDIAKKSFGMFGKLILGFIVVIVVLVGISALMMMADGR